MSVADTPVEAEGRPSSGAVLAGRIAEAAQSRPRRRDLKPLTRLAPYLLRHKGQAAIAVLFMLIAGAATLALPVAGRFIIDRGVTPRNLAETNHWFLVLG